MNEMQLKIKACSENELFARNTVAAFALPLNPSLAQLSDIKTAVSEAVTNCIVHGYAGGEGWITVACRIEGEKFVITVSDEGKGIADLQEALTPFYTSLPGQERSGMGFTIMQTFMTTLSVDSVPGDDEQRLRGKGGIRCWMKRRPSV